MAKPGEKHRMHVAEPRFGRQVGVQTVRTHREEDCGGPLHPNGRPACCIHNPSDHHMVTWALNWRADTRVMERMCPHGVGHPDPDHMAYVMIGNPDTADGVHGCDGCCRAPGPVLTAEQVGNALGVTRDTVIRYLWESQGHGRRYSGNPFPAPKGTIGRSPYWLADQLVALAEWHARRPGRGAGGGPRRKLK